MLCNVYCTVYSMLCVRNTRKHFTMRYVYLTSIGAGGFLGKHLFVHVRVRYTVNWTMYMYGTLCIKYSKASITVYPGTLLYYFCVWQFMQFSLCGLILTFFSIFFLASHPALGRPINRKRSQSRETEVEKR